MNVDGKAADAYNLKPRAHGIITFICWIVIDYIDDVIVLVALTTRLDSRAKSASLMLAF